MIEGTGGRTEKGRSETSRSRRGQRVEGKNNIK